MQGGIGDFLQARRSRLSPEDVGLNRSATRRRVAGLRREELAHLAGVSVDYYVRLEQGRTPNVSDSVLLSIGRVLKLSPTEQEHLGNLARRIPRESLALESSEDETLARLINMSAGVPSLVLGADFRLLASNALARAVFGFAPETPAAPAINLLRLTFLEPTTRERISDLDTIASQLVAHLHLQHGRNPDNEILNELILEMLEASPAFAALWGAQDVADRTIATLTVHHPDVGDIEFTNIWMMLPSRPGRILVSYTVEEGSSSESRLLDLAALGPRNLWFNGATLPSQRRHKFGV